MLLKDAIAGCWTGQCSGLSQQIIDEIEKIKPKLLVRLGHDLIVCEGRQNNPFMQSNAAINLIRVVEARGQKLHINSCFRTIAQQYMLRQQYERSMCGIMAASRPPYSNHNSGMAIDVQDAKIWRPHLEKFNWKWIGSFDPMHFDYKGGGEDMGKLQTLAFQKLWNRHNPNSPLSEDGSYGPATERCLGNSPIDGFGAIALLQRGSFSKEVGELQLKLRAELGLKVEDLAADCKFGPATERYLMEFQSSKGLSNTGVADEATMKVLGL